MLWTGAPPIATFSSSQVRPGGGVVTELDQYATYVASVGNPEFDSESVVFGYAIHGSLERATASATGSVSPERHTCIIRWPAQPSCLPIPRRTFPAATGPNPDGSFVVDGPPPGTYNVSVAELPAPEPGPGPRARHRSPQRVYRLVVHRRRLSFRYDSQPGRQQRPEWRFRPRHSTPPIKRPIWSRPTRWAITRSPVHARHVQSHGRRVSVGDAVRYRPPGGIRQR